MIEFLKYQPFGYDKSMAITAFVFGVFWFIAYNAYVLWHINGIDKDHKEIKILPISISQSYYMIDVRWLFKAFMYSSIFSIICIGQNYLYMIVGVLFFIMAVNPSVNSGDRYLIPHMIGAIGAITLGILGLGICYNMWTTVIITGIGCVLLWVLIKIINNKKISDSFVYFLELYTLTSLMTGFCISLVK